MRKKDNGLRMSGTEFRAKTLLDRYEARFYRVTNRELANELIKTGKFLYFTEKEPHFKTGKMVTVFYFEMVREIHEDVKKIKAKLDEKYKNKKKVK